MTLIEQIKQMESLIAALDEARDELTAEPDWQPEGLFHIDKAYGIAVDVLAELEKVR
jgi:hypothetical protein